MSLRYRDICGVANTSAESADATRDNLITWPNSLPSIDEAKVAPVADLHRGRIRPYPSRLKAVERPPLLCVKLYPAAPLPNRCQKSWNRPYPRKR
jgi:hypothetical protein